MVEDKFYVYPHLGLGDQIICNGIIRNIHDKISKNVVLFCKPEFASTVRFMYRDISVDIHEGDDHQVSRFLQNIPTNRKISIGHQHIMKYINGTTFDCAFYKQVGLNFNKRWTDFYVKRDKEREEMLFKKLELPDNYIFVHDDSSRMFFIKKEYILRPDTYIVRPVASLTNNIFDYLTVMERAAEIHCIDSCFKIMLDSIIDRTSELFFHFNLQGNIIKDRTYAQSRLPWRVI